MAYEFTRPLTDNEQFEAAAASSAYAYHRFESWRATGAIQDDSDIICRIWVHDENSPTKRSLAASLNDSDLAQSILIRNRRI